VRAACDRCLPSTVRSPSSRAAHSTRTRGTRIVAAGHQAPRRCREEGRWLGSTGVGVARRWRGFRRVASYICANAEDMSGEVQLRVLALRGLEDFLDDDHFYITCGVGDDYFEASNPLPGPEPGWETEPFALPLADEGARGIRHLVNSVHTQPWLGATVLSSTRSSLA
jgi:hypothetical protein